MRPILRRVQLGLTLIEMMVSIAIGLVVVGAVSYLYIGSRGAYRGNEALARIQDSGRFALDAIGRDIRRSGALGCGSVASVAGQGPLKVNMAAVSASTGIHPASLTVDASGQPIAIEGFEPTGYTPLPLTAPPSGWTAPGGSSYWGGDILQLQIASGAPVRVTNMDTGVGTVTIVDNTPQPNGAGNFSSPNYALLANCSAAAVFQVQSSSAASGPSTLGYASGTVPVLSSSGQFSLALDTYPTVQHYDQVTFYLGKTLNGLPALYRYSLSSGAADELVANVEDMDVVYGVDNTPNDNVVSADVFWKAAAVTAAGAWPNVVSVRVSVVAVGDQLGAAPTAQTLTFHGTDTAPLVPTAWTATDTRLRQVFTATIALRDRLN